MFDFGDANKKQQEAISTVDGPVLITAGPGTGKTYTLVMRPLYLIQERGVRPEQIMIATFTEKAARELVTRITDALDRREIALDLSAMYIGTIHSICLRILKEHIAFTRLRRNFRTLEPFDQQYLVFRKQRHFLALPHISALGLPPDMWAAARQICTYVNRLGEEMVDPAALMADNDEGVRALGEVLGLYQKLLVHENMLDFSTLQTETYALLTSHPEILRELQDHIRYIMIDEYQDTNYIQEKLVFLLGGARQDICVVGDDDQGLYRFRGATIRNILEFPQKFPRGVCKQIALVENYRSDPRIIDFYTRWMQAPQSLFQWGQFRFPKRIVPHTSGVAACPAVIRIGANGIEAWQARILTFLRRLRQSGALTDYDQVAFLFHSVRGKAAVSLAAYLEANGISVYSPRSRMFFKRDEIRLAVGLLALLFPYTERAIRERAAQAVGTEDDQVLLYLVSCLDQARGLVKSPGNEALLAFVNQTRREIGRIQAPLPYNYTALLYRLYRFAPFSDILGTDLGADITVQRPIRNLARFTGIISKFEMLNSIDAITPEQVQRYTDGLFTQFLEHLFMDGVDEYEDDSDYAPSGCVSFLTYHQAKGLEFPVVITDSLWMSPKAYSDPPMQRTEQEHFHRAPFEPHDQIRFFDFWRLFYTGFSRAKQLLVLTSENDRPSTPFKPFYDSIPDMDDPQFTPARLRLAPVRSVDLKSSFSFTSHITLYEGCPRQYKFYRALGFPAHRAGSMLYGTLVHQTIEDIHKAVLRGETDLVTTEHINGWFSANYATLAKSENLLLPAVQQERARDEVLRYVAAQHGDWSRIREAEVDVSLVRKDHIIKGQIDLVRGEGDTVEIVDFKTGEKPHAVDPYHRLEKYERQLRVYAYLVEQRTGLHVSGMHLYYTGDRTGEPQISFPYSLDALEQTIGEFDETVRRILQNDFSAPSPDPARCDGCDFRFYCHPDREM